jgi:CrcB protein
LVWWDWLLVAAAGACGAPLRYLVDTLVTDKAATVFPYGTLVVNLTGSFVLGVVTGFALDHGLGATEQLVVGTGLVGAYTTFSTFTLESLFLLRAGENGAAVRNVAGSVVAGLLAAAAGWALASL